MTIIQGEGLEYSDTPREKFSGGSWSGGGLPYPSEVLQLWGGKAEEARLPIPGAPHVLSDDGSGPHRYALIALGPQGGRSEPSPKVTAKGYAAPARDSVAGADAYILLRDGREATGPLRIEGSEKRWTDKP